MKYAKKMSLVPYQTGNGAPEFETQQVHETPTPPVASSAPSKPKVNSIRKYAFERQSKLLNVVLKLAKHGMYDENGMVGADGQTFDVVPLLLHCFSPGRSIRGLDS